MRMKNVPSRGSVVCWSEWTMFAPASVSRRDVAATMPGWSGQEIVRRVIGAVAGGEDISRQYPSTSRP
jgi:hypothetical protein